VVDEPLSGGPDWVAGSAEWVAHQVERSRDRDVCARCGHYRVMHRHPQVEPQGWCCGCPEFVGQEKPS
jgi:hypothetical protein